MMTVTFFRLLFFAFVDICGSRFVPRFPAAKLLLTLDLNERETRNEVFPNRLITVLKDYLKKDFSHRELNVQVREGSKNLQGANIYSIGKLILKSYTK